MPKTIYSNGYIALVHRIRDQRVKQGMTQQQLADLVARSRTWIQKVEACERRMDFLETLDMLNALRIEMDEAVRLVQEKPR